MKLASLLLLSAIALPACSNNGGGTSSSFNLMFAPPGGSGFAGGQVSPLGFGGSSTRNFTLLPGITVSGKVTDGTGAPLTSATVSFHVTATDPAVDSDGTNGTGDYTLTVPAGTWVAVVDSGDNALGKKTVTSQVVAAPGPATFNYQFGAKVTVSGQVAQFGGPGIPNSTIDFTGANSGATVSVTADGSGNYTAQLLPDTYDAVVTPVGAAAATHLKEKFVNVAVAGPTTRSFGLTAGVQVSGTVRDNVGSPLLEGTEIKVILAVTSNFFAPSKVTANSADGTYTMGPVPPGSATFELKPPASSSYPLQQFTRTIFNATQQPEDFTLAKGFLLTGTILRDDNVTPEKNVKVAPIPTNGALAPDDKNTDSSGAYTIALFAGTYTVQLTPKTTNLQLPETRTITVTGNTTLNVTLSRGAILTGTVGDTAGTPAPDIKVEIAGVTGASSVSDGSGVYSFLAPVGTHTLTLSAVDGQFQDMALAPVTGVIVALPGPVTNNFNFAFATTGNTVVSGTVFQPDGSTPAQGVAVTARNNQTGAVIGRAVSAAGGTYTLVIP